MSWVTSPRRGTHAPGNRSTMAPLEASALEAGILQGLPSSRPRSLDSETATVRMATTMLADARGPFPSELGGLMAFPDTPPLLVRLYIPAVVTRHSAYLALCSLVGRSCCYVLLPKQIIRQNAGAHQNKSKQSGLLKHD